MIRTGTIICIPTNVQSIKAILLYLSTENHLSPKLKSLDGKTLIYFTSRAYLYVQLSPPLFTVDHRCFQIDLDSTDITGQIQFIYPIESRETKELGTLVQPVNPCLTRRIKCKNGGQCQVLSTGQTKCLCPDHISGNDCENSKLEFLSTALNKKNFFSWHSMYEHHLYQPRYLFR